MKRSALAIPVGVAFAVLLLIGAVNESQKAFPQSNPYAAVSWLAAIAALGAFAVMLAEYFIHGRQAQLYLAGAFIAVGIIGVWDAITFSYGVAFGVRAASEAPTWAYLLLWQLQWVTLAIGLIYGMVLGRRFSPKDQTMGRAIIACMVGILWAAVLVFAVSNYGFRAASHGIWITRAGMITSAACAAVFAITCFGFGRTSIHRRSAVLGWMAYGLIFAVLAELAMALKAEPSRSFFWFASLMKALVFLTPLAGMLAEHTRLQVRLRDQSAEMSGILQAQEAVASVSSPSELFRRIAELAASALGASAACVMPFDKDRGLLRVAAHVGLDDDLVKRFTFRAGEGPSGDCYSDRVQILVRDVLEDRILGSKLDGLSGLKTAVFAPLIAREECHGILALFFAGKPIHKLSKEQSRMLDALANQAALAIESVELRGRILDSAKTSGGYAQELETVWDIGRAVGSELELNALVDALSEKLKSAVGATACSVLVFEPDLVGLKILGDKKLARYESVADHVDQCDVIAAQVARKAEAITINDVANSRHCKYSEMATEDGGVHHMLSVPMSLRGFVGAISVFRQNGEPFGESEKRLLTRLAPVVAAGIRNAQLYERESSIAQSLQETLRSRVEQRFKEIAVSGGYQAAFDESLVGGDFYDVIEFGGGKYGIAIGDVSGKGIEAAVYTAMARYMIQAYSADDTDPVYVISKLNTALCRYTPVGKFVTAIYGIVDAEAKTFTYVNAGHEIPFIFRGNSGNLEALASTGPAAGALEEGEYRSEQIAFEPSDTLIFYTDGATEARSEGKFLGTEGLQKIITDLIGRHPDDLPKAIITSIRSYAKGRLRDDIAILTVKCRVPGALF